MIEHLTHFPEATRDFLKNNASFVDNLASFIEEHSYHIEKMTINCSPLSNGEYKDREDIWNYLSENPQLTTVSGGYKNLEFTMCGTTKAIGLQFLADMLQVPMECTMACGDSQNDIDILQAAAVGVVMENASDNLKSIADFITKSNNDSGVAYAIKQLVLNHS